MRPLLGLPVKGTGVLETVSKKPKWRIIPNPATTQVQIDWDGDKEARFTICDMTGRIVASGKPGKENTVDISALKPGLYIVQLSSGTEILDIQKLTKL